LATLAIASNNSNAVAANAINAMGPRSPTMDSSSGRKTKTRLRAWSGYLLRERFPHWSERALHIAGRHARTQSNVGIVAVANRLRVLLRHPEIGVVRSVERRRRDADHNGQSRRWRDESCADDGGICAEQAAPRAIRIAPSSGWATPGGRLE
jgi:hypothetical protein